MAETQCHRLDGGASAAEYVAERLVEMQEQPVELLRADMIDLVEDSTIPQYEASEGVAFRDQAEDMIEGLDESQLRRLAELWYGFVMEPEHWEGMTEAVLATHQATATNAYDVDLEQWGLVVVGNFHDITVDIGVFLPRNRRFLRYVTIEQVEQNIRVRQYGLVAVYTIDNVEVNLSVAADRGVETAGLEYALNRAVR